MSSVPVLNPISLGAAVRERRLSAARTQAEVAADAGVSRAWLIRFEDGHPRAELFRVFAVLRALGVSLHLDDDITTDQDREELAFLDQLLGADDER
ncbi:helix-turn-helix domain-containing protein [Aeromicrobium sp. CFBP 8757]|uniref:helix-turn-helix domain-containing protein n=1 Tax=Aeromicrobium sp. CFBP 8757 TaxID=2775288 RepID=UPI0017832647|nr:helix-turn-helix domain-containing protein [Aeromicrobium sp. CFBP 8757]MBD8608833.1 helix-turn-helix domain-containing protein [Aeromicrobium sp. CFBP 8757]